jgi:hypothetical protein
VLTMQDDVAPLQDDAGLSWATVVDCVHHRF